MTMQLHLLNEFGVPLALGPFVRLTLNGEFLEREDGRVLAQLVNGTWYCMDGDRPFVALRALVLEEVVR